MQHMVRLYDLGKDIGSFCFKACSSSLLFHPEGGRPGGARVVTSYTGVVLRYTGSYRYGRAPWSSRGRWQMVTVISVRHTLAGLAKFPTFG